MNHPVAESDPQSNALKTGCDLCGLSLAAGAFEAEFNGQFHRFCCLGCRMVFTMLMEADDGGDPLRFKETALYRQCVAAGVIPADQEALVAIQRVEQPPKIPVPIESMGEDPDLVFQGRVDGMWCPACAWVIENALRRIGGVYSAVCDFSIDRLQCRYDPTRIAPKELMDAVARLGYAMRGDQDPDQVRMLHSETIRLIITALLSVNVMMISWALYSGFFTELSARAIRYLSWPIFILATAVFVYAGGPVIRKAWAGLRAAAPGMEVLVVLGAGSAFGLSVVNFINGNIHLYFDTASMLLTLLLLGKWLEARAKNRVRRDLEGFLAMLPSKAQLCTPQVPNGRYVAAAQLGSGDRIKVAAGFMVPADGRVLDGRAVVDVSAITGEPEPLHVGNGDLIIGGSRVISGRIDIQVAVAGSETLLGQMISVVQSTLSQKSMSENRSMRKLALFVPLIMTLALLAGAVYYARGGPFDQAMVRAITVLVVACPCTLAIAVPLARVAGMSGAGRRGLLVRDVNAFDQAGRTDTVIFDKTGTLTAGKWTLEEIDAQGDLSCDQALSLALALEKDVDHTIAWAVRELARQRDVTAAAVTRIRPTADGISGYWNHQMVKVGSRRFAAGKEESDSIQPPPRTGRLSQVYLAVDGRIQAIFHFGDRLRPSAGALVSRLQTRGYDVHLISGDTPAATRAVAEELGIQRFHGGMLPHEKSKYISFLKEKGAKTTMLGDGINDAAALAKADLAVAVHGGAALVHQVGAVTLMRGDPFQLLDFFQWARRVNRKINQNYGWAWIYNLIAIPLAMAGLMTPLVAVTAMLLSSLSVIGNTLLLVPAGRKMGTNESWTTGT